MSSWIRWILTVAVVIGAAAGGYWYGHRNVAAAPEAPAEATTQPADAPVAPVVTAAARRGLLEEKITVYGGVVSQLGEMRTITVAFESRVGQVLVTPGQQVAVGTPLISIEPSPATLLAQQEAQNTLNTAERDLKQVQQRFEQKLATNQELSAVQSAFQSAQAKLSNLSKSGAGNPQQLKSDTAGVVGKVDVQLGQIVAPGAPMVEVVAEDRIEVRLGIEPEDVPHLSVGQPVNVSPVNFAAPTAISCKVRLITQRVNPDTRLVDVFASLPKGEKLMLEGFVQGELTLRSADGIIIPRGAALPDDNGYAVFTAEKGHAVKHIVQIGLENDEFVQVEGDVLHAGDPVIIVGNYELQDGMAIEIEEHPTTVPTTAPAIAPATAPASAPATTPATPATEGAK